ncbi:2-keto-4-pentenoate hydratase [Acidisphaera rubrifaciens]|uniref:Hydratase n=1 Tax=Acidisphaera rubrifaciens HS-AP3 TaxID=1231350 RepID=A0A0D6P8A2_9PROT|nr:fumarylacetoacetate hydrolase family protein [Acidisphaera rubrifaciens]GAN77433.1 hydratase [Acidisphaera rubrifaciens HS-AP3]
MNDPAQAAADLLWEHWQAGTRIDALPPALRPRDRAQGYAIQARQEARDDAPLFGWKIAATSAAGQAHIGVDGPLAGRILRERVLRPGARIILGTTAMRVAEAEFAFAFARDLPPRAAPYGMDEVLAAVAALHLSIEIPDSRYEDFTRAGAPALIADNACAHLLVVGPPVEVPWRDADLAAHAVVARVSGGAVAEGRGANVLGDPRAALTWLVNEVAAHGGGLRAGQIVTTGTCITPIAIAPGQSCVADYGRLGRMTVHFT